VGYGHRLPEEPSDTHTDISGWDVECNHPATIFDLLKPESARQL